MPAPFPSVSDEFTARDATAADGSLSLSVGVDESIAVFAPVLGDFVLVVNDVSGASPVNVVQTGPAAFRCDFASPFDLGNPYRLRYTRSTSEIRSDDGSVLADFDVAVAVLP